MPGDCATDAQNEVRESRQALAFEHVFENQLELWNNEDHQDRQDCHGNEHHGAGIKHGRLDFAANLLGLLHEFRQTVQDHFQHAAQFAGFDHVHIKPIEHFRVLRQTLGEGAAAFDCQRKIIDNLFEVGVFFLPFQHPQSAQQGQTGVHQRRQLPGKRRQYLWFDLSAKAGDPDIDVEPALFFPFRVSRRAFGLLIGLFFGFFRFDHLRGEVAHFFEPADRFVLVRHLQSAFGLLTSRIHGDVVEFWHN